MTKLIRLLDSMKRYTKSKSLYARARGSLAGGVSSEFRKASHPHPLFFDHGRGARITDVDGNEYLDFTLSQGPLILGHSHPEVLDTVNALCARGQIFAGQYLEEIELAETIQRLVPCAERMRFSLSGSESDHIAIRLARAATGRGRFIRFEGHYHGWFDNVSISVGAASAQALGERQAPVQVPWTRGLPDRIGEEMIVLPWNDLGLVRETVGARHREIAAIVTEPVMCNNGCVEPDPGFLAGLRELCDEHGIALIFDEVITGFRLGLAGAQGHYGVTPDLAIFGKAMANGYPISLLAGKERWMRWISDGKVIHAGTMNSGQPGVAAAAATLRVLERDRVHERLFRLGARLMAGLREAGARFNHPLLVQGPGPMFHLGFTDVQSVHDLRDTFQYDKLKLGRFVAAMQDRGVRLIGRGLWYISAAHTDADVDRALEVATDVLQDL